MPVRPYLAAQACLIIISHIVMLVIRVKQYPIGLVYNI